MYCIGVAIDAVIYLSVMKVTIYLRNLKMKLFAKVELWLRKN